MSFIAKDSTTGYGSIVPDAPDAQSHDKVGDYVDREQTKEKTQVIILFSGGGGSRTRKKQGEDVKQVLKVSLEEVYNGITKKLSLSRNILCKKCKGYVSHKVKPFS